MPLMEWTDDLDTGIPVIDGDHKKLLAMLNDLHDSVVSERDAVSVGKILDGLVLYTAFHFRREEKLLSDAAYPGEAAHKKEHLALTQRVLDVQKKYKSGSEGISQELLVFIKGWLINHIKIIDKKYVPHLVARGVV